MRLRSALLVALLAAAGIAGRGAVAQQNQTLSWQGTLAPSAGVSMALTAANTVLPTGMTIPANFYWLTVINTGSNSTLVCWRLAVAAAGLGCETLAAGASDRVNLNGSTVTPSFFSASGTTLAVHD